MIKLYLLCGPVLGYYLLKALFIVNSVSFGLRFVLYGIIIYNI